MATGYNYHGYTIMHDEADPDLGWWVMSGYRVVGDADSDADARDLIDALYAEECEVNAMMQEDTPSLPAPWWEAR